MKIIGDNLRKILHFLKTDTYRNDENKIKECKDKIYDMTKDNIDFFNGNKMYQSNLIAYIIPYDQIKRLTPKELCELSDRFEISATGFYGMKYDNLTRIYYTDYKGNMYCLTCFSPDNYSVSCYEFYVSDIVTKERLYYFKVKLDDNKWDNKDLEKLMNGFEKEKQENLKKHIKDQLRKEQVYGCKKYITKEVLESNGYHVKYKLTIDKNIPIKLSDNDVLKYADDWNLCFGGTIDRINETKETNEYYVTVYID